MFKKAVESHNAHQTERKPATLSQQLFSSSPPVAPLAAEKKIPQQTPFLTRPTTRPLSNGTGNKQKTPAANAINAQNFHTGNGLKRTSSGLVKALETEDPFAEPTPPPTASLKHNTNIGRRPSPAKNNTMSTGADLGVYFDENDFDSDIDLDVEDPATKPSISYPTLPPPEKPAPKPVQKPAPPSITGFVRREQTHDSGYESQPVVKDEPRTQGNNSNQLSPQRSSTHILKSSQPIPWSSSPPEHLEPPSRHAREIRQFAYTDQNRGDVDEQPRPTKRRTLPWLEERREEQEEEQGERDQDRMRKSTTSKADFTPLPKDKEKKYPWNTTASAIKEQQKALRQTNKKLTKDHAATTEAQKMAVEQKKKKTISRVFLSDEQQHVLSLVLDSKKSVFFTGSAGTGKSVLLREIIAGLKKKFQREPDRVAVTASTGLAACNIGGVTLHSFAGFGLGKEGVEELVKKIKRNQKAKHRWMRTKVLIVDEVSMVDGDMFDKLEAIARTLRNNGRPFGGIQLIITGDFFQLPPVPEGGKQAKFAFDAGTWTTSIEHTIGLHHVFRQKDPVFAGMLNEMREGRLMPSSIDAFKKLSRPLNFEDTLEATELFPTRTEVDRANQNRMSRLHGETRVFQAMDGGTITDKAFRDKLLSNCMAPEAIQLKKGAQVMLIKNIDETLVNGSLGKVIGFMNEAMFDNYQENEDQFLASQADGDTDEALALQSLAAKRKSKITEMLAQPSQLYPVVRFTLADGTTRDLLCQRESWKIELPNGEVQASRSQIPLILAWALSIHKAQGQTLERVKVDLGKVFEKGQAYVALSRATSMGGLQVLRFDPRKVVAHDRVRSFYAGLSRAETKEEGREKKGRGKGISAEDYERGFVDDGWGDAGVDIAYG